MESKSESSATLDIREENVPALTNLALSDVKVAESKDPRPQPPEEEYRGPKRNFRFWLVFVALCCSLFLSSLDLGGVGTAAPTIVHDLNGINFSWVGSAYALGHFPGLCAGHCCLQHRNTGAASCLPLAGNLASIFGRRPILLGSLVLFSVGSAVSGSARTMNILIVGRGKSPLS